jgi:hypothetical protein
MSGIDRWCCYMSGTAERVFLIEGAAVKVIHSDSTLLPKIDPNLWNVSTRAMIQQ